MARDDIVRLILDGTVIKTMLDRKATNISVLAAIGVRRDGQKVLLSIKNMGGESKAAHPRSADRVPFGNRIEGLLAFDGLSSSAISMRAA